MNIMDQNTIEHHKKMPQMLSLDKHLQHMRTAFAILLEYLRIHEHNSAVLKWYGFHGSPFFTSILLLIRIQYRHYMWHKSRWLNMKVIIDE
jgi:hypothetical protein